MTAIDLQNPEHQFDFLCFQIEDGDFTWGSKDSAPVLKNINLEIPYGKYEVKLIAIFCILTKQI